jgi:hypothetical protein
MSKYLLPDSVWAPAQPVVKHVISHHYVEGPIVEMDTFGQNTKILG